MTGLEDALNRKLLIPFNSDRSQYSGLKDLYHILVERLHRLGVTESANFSELAAMVESAYVMDTQPG